MVEATLRVEVLENRNFNNPFYGTTMVKKVVEDIFIHDYDKRKEIAPCGVKATIAVDTVFGENATQNSKRIIDIKINRYYLERESSGGYVAFFSVEEKVYEVFVHFNGKHITYMTLSEWLKSGDFEDGEDADNIYDSQKFVSIEIIES
jgi:hypothetical protein